MEKIRHFIVHFLEVLVILILILGIIFGLESIGIFSFSELLPWVNPENKDENSDYLRYDNDIYEALSENNSTDTVSVVSDLSREHVIKILDEITVADNYYQEYNISLLDDNGHSFDSKATISRKDMMYDVSLYTSAGNVYKRIRESADTVEIFNFDNGTENKTTLKKGSFDIQSDSGIIMTHDRFFSDYASYADDEFYSVAYSDFGSVLYFEFLTELEGYSQKECYWLSLDFGVIIKAECYENDNLVYSLETITINSGI